MLDTKCKLEKIGKLKGEKKIHRSTSPSQSVLILCWFTPFQTLAHAYVSCPSNNFYLE